MIPIFSLIIALIAMLIGGLSWRDKRIFAKNAELNQQFSAIHQDIKDLREKVSINERHLHVLDERVQNDIHTTTTILTSMEKKLDDLEKSLWNR